MHKSAGWATPAGRQVNRTPSWSCYEKADWRPSDCIHSRRMSLANPKTGGFKHAGIGRARCDGKCGTEQKTKPEAAKSEGSYLRRYVRSRWFTVTSSAVLVCSLPAQIWRASLRHRLAEKGNWRLDSGAALGVSLPRRSLQCLTGLMGLEGVLATQAPSPNWKDAMMALRISYPTPHLFLVL